METEKLGTVWGQLIGIGSLILVPLIIVYFVIESGPKGPTEDWGGAALVTYAIGGLTGILVCTPMFFRRQIVLSDNKLVISHSFYTLSIARSDVSSVTVTELAKADELGISTKKNGVAGFGYLSGWYNGPYGDLMFCAISSRPIYRVELDGNLRCSIIGLSCSAQMAQQIARWV